MDGGVHVKNADRNVEKLLTEVQYIPFFDAMGSQDAESLGLTKTEFHELMYELNERTGGKKDHVEKQLQGIRIDIDFYTACLVLLGCNGLSEELISILKGRGISDSDNEKLFNKIEKIIKGLNSKYKLVDGQRPKNKAAKKITGYDVIASLSASLEYRLPMDMCIAEYIGHTNTAKRKREANKPKKKKHGNTR